ncbi:hypothetical protein GY45DRAFT_1063017 [Cubamyces sp. BRFM 1775]|nr:hypothetical protein GY45DRAFT_1063017 [Cubamyces sp. BRFM 1775]
MRTGVPWLRAPNPELLTVPCLIVVILWVPCDSTRSAPGPRTLMTGVVAMPAQDTQAHYATMAALRSAPCPCMSRYSRLRQQCAACYIARG